MKGDPVVKESTNNLDNDSSATDTCSDLDFWKETDEATDTCSEPDLLKESDEDLSDNEEEREHYIIRYPLKSVVKKETNNIFDDPLSIDDPFEQVNEEMIIKNIVCRYCSFACDSEYILFTHIDQNHKKQLSNYTCNFPFCNFSSNNMLELITHKDKCPNNPDTNKNRHKNTKSRFNVKEETEVQKSTNDQENIENDNQEEKSPVIKVKPDYKLKSPVVQEPLISDEPNEPSTLVISLKKNNNNNNSKNLISLDSWKQSCKKIRYTNRPTNKRCQKHVKKCYKCYTCYKSYQLNRLMNCRKVLLKPGIDPFGDDLLFRIRVEIENQGLEDHNYSKINFFQKMGLNKLKNGSCQLALKNILDHLKSKLDFKLIPNLRAYPEQTVLLHLIRQLEEIKSTYASKAFKSKNSNRKQGVTKQNHNPVLLANIPLRFSSEKQFKVMVPNKRMNKILLKSDAKLLIEGNVSSNKNFRRILPKKNPLEQKKINGNSASCELLTRDEPTSSNLLPSNIKTSSVKVLPSNTKTSSVKVLPSNIKTSSVKVLPSNTKTSSVKVLPSNIKTSSAKVLPSNIKTSSVKVLPSNVQKKSNVAAQKISTNRKVTIPKRFSDSINTNKTIDSKINYEEKLTSIVKESSNLKRKNIDDQKPRKKINSSSGKKVENVVSGKTVSEELSEKIITFDEMQKISEPKDDQTAVSKNESFGESEFQLPNKSSPTIEANNLVPLAHTCKKNKKRRMRKREGRGGYWTRKKNKVTCKACIEEKKD